MNRWFKWKNPWWWLEVWIIVAWLWTVLDPWFIPDGMITEFKGVLVLFAPLLIPVELVMQTFNWFLGVLGSLV